MAFFIATNIIIRRSLLCIFYFITCVFYNCDKRSDSKCNYFAEDSSRERFLTSLTFCSSMILSFPLNEYFLQNSCLYLLFLVLYSHFSWTNCSQVWHPIKYFWTSFHQRWLFPYIYLITITNKVKLSLLMH